MASNPGTQTEPDWHEFYTQSQIKLYAEQEKTARQDNGFPMKFRVTMKDPDGPYECIRDAAKESVANVETLSDEEREGLEERRTESLTKFANKWLEYGEYALIEFDTDAGTATLIKKGG